MKTIASSVIVVMLIKQESLREFYWGHFCLGNPHGRVLFINKFVGQHENLFYCKYPLEMKTRYRIYSNKHPTSN